MYTWEQTEQMIHNCQRCSLSRTRNLPVMGRGNRAAKIMFVAEAPGAQEDRQGVPFVGPAGRVLDVLLTSIQLKSAGYLSDQYCQMPSAGQSGPFSGRARGLSAILKM